MTMNSSVVWVKIAWTFGLVGLGGADGLLLALQVEIFGAMM